MKKFTVRLLATLGFAVLAAVVSSSLSNNTKATQTAPVLVTNSGAAQAIPMAAQGTTTVAGTVSAAQSGAWDVGIAGMPTVNLASGSTVGISVTPTVSLASGSAIALNGSVTVGNPVTSPVLVRDLDEPARNSFVAGLSCSMVDGNSICQGGKVFVPALKEFVAETVTAVVQVPTGDPVLVSISINGDVTRYYLPLKLATTNNGSDIYTVESPAIRFYVDAGSSIEVDMNTLSTSTGMRSVSATIAGHTVDCGSAVSGCPLP